MEMADSEMLTCLCVYSAEGLKSVFWPNTCWILSYSETCVDFDVAHLAVNWIWEIVPQEIVL